VVGSRCRAKGWVLHPIAAVGWLAKHMLVQLRCFGRAHPQLNQQVLCEPAAVAVQLLIGLGGSRLSGCSCGEPVQGTTGGAAPHSSRRLDVLAGHMLVQLLLNILITCGRAQ
jgi:hypothetical protein